MSPQVSESGGSKFCFARSAREIFFPTFKTMTPPLRIYSTVAVLRPPIGGGGGGFLDPPMGGGFFSRGLDPPYHFSTPPPIVKILYNRLITAEIKTFSCTVLWCKMLQGEN